MKQRAPNTTFSAYTKNLYMVFQITLIIRNCLENQNSCSYHEDNHKGPPSELEYSFIFAPNTRLKIAVSFMTMFKAGPDVSFRGSPTVSPVTEFECASEPFLISSPRPPALISH